MITYIKDLARRIVADEIEAEVDDAYYQGHELGERFGRWDTAVQRKHDVQMQIAQGYAEGFEACLEMAVEDIEHAKAEGFAYGHEEGHSVGKAEGILIGQAIAQRQAGDAIRAAFRGWLGQRICQIVAEAASKEILNLDA